MPKEKIDFNASIGRVNNQKFVTIPHARFIDMLTKKLEAVGITVKVGEESYTSRASFMDWDSIPTYQPGIRFDLSIGYSQSRSHTTSVSELLGFGEKEGWDLLTAKEQEEELQVCLSDWQNNYIESNWRIANA